MVRSTLLVYVAAAGLAWLRGYPEPVAPVGDGVASTIAQQYRQSAERIIAAALSGNDAYAKLEELCLDIGRRLSGSPQLEQAVAWAVVRLQRDSQENVRREPVMVPRWVRGAESARMIEPRAEPLHVLGLGGSVGTPPEGITAPVVVVADEEELAARAAEVPGRIVLFNKKMPSYHPERGSGYGETVKYRTHGARLAAAHGAVACLVRSVTSRSLRSPHTGAMDYGEALTRIPAAAVAVEDAELLARLHDRGERVTVELRMEAQTLPEVESANVVAELRGTARPYEIVVIGGHLDTWDVGQGAHDDGAGVVMAMEAINVLRKLGMVPRRTIRVVLWTNEENGLAGARAYADRHADELSNHVAAIEADSGAFEPIGYSLECLDQSREAAARGQLEAIVALLSPLGAMTVKTGDSGADVSQMKPGGVIVMGHRVEGSTYFDYHHTHADTIDKVDPELLSRNVAALAVVAYVIADMPARLGESGTP